MQQQTKKKKTGGFWGPPTVGNRINLVGVWNLERLNDTVWTMFLPTCTLDVTSVHHRNSYNFDTSVCVRVSVLNSGLWGKMAKLLNRKTGKTWRPGYSWSCLFARYWICWMQDKWQAPPLPDLFHSSILLLSELALVPEKWLMFIQNVTLPEGRLKGTLVVPLSKWNTHVLRLMVATRLEVRF